MPTGANVQGTTFEFNALKGRARTPGYPAYKDYKMLKWFAIGEASPGLSVTADVARWRVHQDSIIIGLTAWGMVKTPEDAETNQGLLDLFLIMNGLWVPIWEGNVFVHNALGTDIGYRSDLSRSQQFIVTGLSIPLQEDDEIWLRMIGSNLLGVAAVMYSFEAAMIVHLLEK